MEDNPLLDSPGSLHHGVPSALPSAPGGGGTGPAGGGGGGGVTVVPHDPFARPLDGIAPWNFTLLAALMGTITALSLGENFAVILVTVRFRQLRQPLNYVLVNLAAADLLVSAVGGSVSFFTNLKGYFFLGVQACVLEGFAVTYFGVVALWSLALLAFERYFVICRPLGNFRLQAKHAGLGLAVVWIFSLACTLPPVLGWSSYRPSMIGTTCEPNWYSGDMHDHTFIMMFFTTCFIFPLTVIFVSYGKLIQKLKKASETQRGLESTRRAEQQVTRMVVVMILAFLFCWMPYATFSIVVTACPSIHIDPLLAAVPAFFSKTATVYNPVIYVFMNKQFRDCFLQVLPCGGLKKSSVTQTAGARNTEHTASVDRLSPGGRHRISLAAAAAAGGPKFTSAVAPGPATGIVEPTLAVAASVESLASKSAAPYQHRQQQQPEGGQYQGPSNPAITHVQPLLTRAESVNKIYPV
uniref:Vertebrate ancient long opsin n=1 Tax=Geotria australis TaxID=71168 RepID=A0A1B1SK64_9VERT|nr:vertebrate ancient long opsin [Geotria australis]